MIIVDSSVWIDHFRNADPVLIDALLTQRVLQHPMVTLELALGSIPRRDATLADLGLLPQAPLIEADKLLPFINQEALHGTGIGLIDAHLLASARLSTGTRLWTRDKRLAAQSARLGLAFQS
ncbi:MAG: type II toxin-antitoxin system VapC family toxin [Novosphingobium sp.]